MTVHLIFVLSNSIKIREIIGLILYIVGLIGIFGSNLLKVCLDPGTDLFRLEADL
jgi:hypothetical protein